MSRAVARAACVLAALGATSALAVDVVYQVSARQDVRARTPLPGDSATVLTSDVELDPQGQVAFTWSTTTLGLQYAPQLIWREPQTGGRLLPLHRLRVGLGRRWERASLLLSQEGSQGVLDLGSLRDDPDSPTGSLPPVVTLGGVPYVRSASLLTLDAQPSTRASFQLSGGYFISGATDPLVTNLPLQYGPAGNGTFRYRLTRLDTLVLSSQVLQATFVTGQDQFFLTGLAGWERVLTRPLTLLLQGGVAVVQGWKPADVYGPPGAYGGVVPALAATLSLRERLRGKPLRLELSGRLTPYSDRFTGLIFERFETRLFGEWRFDRDWTATGSAGFAFAAPLFGATASAAAAAGNQALVYGDASVGWVARQWLLLGVTARVLMSQVSGANSSGQVQAVTTFSVTVREQDATAW